MMSRTDGTAVTSANKAAFLQSWLFFGTLYEVSRLCDLSIDIEAEFVVGDGHRVSTVALNGLSGRWFASLDSQTIGNKTFMDKIFAISRQMALLAAEETASRTERQPVFQYTPDEALVFVAIEILLRVLGLHLLLHVSSPRFSRPAAEGIDYKQIVTVVNGPLSKLGVGYLEGEENLIHFFRQETASGTRGWCQSELKLRRSLLTRFLPFIDRLRHARDHSSCSENMCSAYQVDEETYTTFHVDEECSCPFVYVPTEDLVDRLSLNIVPTIIITKDLKLQVVDSSELSYIALSHVCKYSTECLLCERVLTH